MLSNTPAEVEVINFGQIGKIVAPQGWVLEDAQEDSLSAKKLKLFHVADAREINITVYFRGAPVSDTSASRLLALFKAKPALKAPEQLSLEEVKSLTQVFGYSTAGDNQFTNEAKRGSDEFPVFTMELAETVQINGKTVLRVTGTFQNRQAVPTMEYKGIFFTDNESGRNVEEVFYQAPSRGKYLRYLSAFDECLSTIEWR